MFIDTANLSQIKEMLQFNQFEGVTTNPKLLLKEDSRLKARRFIRSAGG